MLQALIFISVLSLLIVVHEWGHFLAARRVGVRIERFSIGFGPKLLTRKRGETEFAVSLVPLGGYVKLAGEQPGEEARGAPWEFLSKPIWQRGWIVVAGPLMNYLMGWMCFWAVFTIGLPVTGTTIGSLLEGYPAQRASLAAGDRIVAINGRSVRTWDELTQAIHREVQGPVTVTFERGGALDMRSVTPKVEERVNLFNERTQVGLIGIAPSHEDVILLQYPWLRAGGEAAKHVVELTGVTLKALGKLLLGHLSVRESLTGPIGIYILTSEATKLGLPYLLHLIGLLSISLAVLNLIPFPVLDGGHLAFLAIEKMRGRAVHPKVQEVVTQIGLFLLVALILAVFYNDLLRYDVGGKFLEWWKR